MRQGCQKQDTTVSAAAFNKLSMVCPEFLRNEKSPQHQSAGARFSNLQTINQTFAGRRRRPGGAATVRMPIPARDHRRWLGHGRRFADIVKGRV